MDNRMKNKVWNKTNTIYKKFLGMLALFLILLNLCGCSLAKEDAGGEAQVNTDRLVGAFVTTEYLDLFDMDAYLNEHAEEVMGSGSDGRMIDGREYSRRMYATIDYHNSTEPQDWEIRFGDVEGVCFFDAKWQREGEEPFRMMTCGDEICDVTRHLNVSEKGESTTMTGVMYALVGEDVDEISIYFNPVYQMETGELYVVSGNSYSLAGEIGGSFSMQLEEKTSVTENGESQEWGCTVELTVEILRARPSKISFHFLNEDLEMLHTEEYAAGEVPTELEVVENTACMVVETVWTDGEVTRELFEPNESEQSYVETFYKVSDEVLGKQTTEMIWK